MNLVAQRVKELRTLAELSVEEVAAAAGVSTSTYIDFENGDYDPSFTFLYKCASLFSVDLGQIVSGDDPKLSYYTVNRNGHGMPIKRRQGFEYRHIASLMKGRTSEPFLVTAPYSEQADRQTIALSTHGGQELNYVLEGTLKVSLNGYTEILQKGDSIYYDASKPHGMVATNGKDCVFLAIVSHGDSAPEQVTGQYGTIKPVERFTDHGDLIYKKYVEEEFDAAGNLVKFDLKPTQNFNFAYDVVDVLAEKSPDKTAMLWVSNKKEDKTFTFKDMGVLSSKAAGYFASLGIKKGDKVMLVLKSHYQFWYAILGLHKLGAVGIPATNLLTTKDLVYRFNSAGVKAVICTSDGNVSDSILKALPESPTVQVLAMVNGAKEGFLDFDAGVLAAPDTFAQPADKVSKDDPMLMYFTSGTTGYPKIAVQSYIYPLGHIATARFWQNVYPEGLHYTVSETGWAKSVWGKLYGQWLCEAGVFTYDFDRFEPDDILQTFAKYNITTFCAPPTMYRMFIIEDLSKYDLSSLKYATIAGEALNPEVYQQFLNATGLSLMEGYGQTETTLTVANFVGATPKPGSMGKPNPQYDIDIILATGESAQVGEVGEIILRTDKRTPPGIFSGYYNNPEITKAAWSDGVYHTGDMAWSDEDGYFWYVGRTDDLIKSSGYRIGPFEIESVLMELPYVLECAVTGMPDPVRGQVVKATIVLTKNQTGSDALIKEIQDYVKKHTAPYKYPRVVEFVEALPKTISGKIRRVEIRDNK